MSDKPDKLSDFGQRQMYVVAAELAKRRAPETSKRWYWVFQIAGIVFLLMLLTGALGLLLWLGQLILYRSVDLQLVIQTLLVLMFIYPSWRLTVFSHKKSGLRDLRA